MVQSEEVRPGMVLDFDRDDRVVTVEILNVRKQFWNLIYPLCGWKRRYNCGCNQCVLTHAKCILQSINNGRSNVQSYVQDCVLHVPDAGMCG